MERECLVAGIDHLVITTADLARCLDFYVGVLGMRHEVVGGHHSLRFGACKISLHTRKGEFAPSARHPAYGAQDFCLLAGADLERVMERLRACGCQVAEGPVRRNGGAGPIRSIYLYDPDGNLVELCQPLPEG